MTKGERIRLRREQLGITQTQLAEAIGSTKQNVYKYENNVISNIPSDKIEAIAAVLQTEPAYLMGWEVKDADSPSEKDPLADQLFAAYNGGKEVFDQDDIDSFT